MRGVPTNGSASWRLEVFTRALALLPRPIWLSCHIWHSAPSVCGSGLKSLAQIGQARPSNTICEVFRPMGAPAGDLRFFIGLWLYGPFIGVVPPGRRGQRTSRLNVRCENSAGELAFAAELDWLGAWRVAPRLHLTADQRARREAQQAAESRGSTYRSELSRDIASKGAKIAVSGRFVPRGLPCQPDRIWLESSVF